MQQKPHVVLIMADQLRRDCVSAYNRTFARTYTLEALAAESTVFDRAYCTTPLCVPTRTSIYTGVWPHTSGVIVNKGGIPGEYAHAQLPEGVETLYERLAGNGYGVNHVGIHHCHTVPPVEERTDPDFFEAGERWAAFAPTVGLPPTPYYAYLAPHVRANSVPVPNYDDGTPVPMFFPTPRAGYRFHGTVEETIDGFWAQTAVDRIREIDFSRPQFLEVLFWAPHPPHAVPEPYYSMFDPAAIPLPESVGRWYDGQPGTLLLQTCGHLGSCANLEDYRRAWALYLGLVVMVDQLIGRVITALKARGVWDETLVIFCSDHGEMLGSHRLWEKHCHYEEAAHVPMMIKPPGGGAKKRSDELVGHLDLAPTICDYAGIPAAGTYWGSSLRERIDASPGGTTSTGALAGTAAAGTEAPPTSVAPLRDALFMEFNGDHGRSPYTRAVVLAKDGATWKYIYTAGDRDELYRLDTDPDETTNLASVEEHMSVRREARTRLERWMQETGDFLAIE